MKGQEVVNLFKTMLPMYFYNWAGGEVDIFCCHLSHTILADCRYYISWLRRSPFPALAEKTKYLDPKDLDFKYLDTIASFNSIPFFPTFQHSPPEVNLSICLTVEWTSAALVEVSTIKIGILWDIKIGGWGSAHWLWCPFHPNPALSLASFWLTKVQAEGSWP